MKDRGEVRDKFTELYCRLLQILLSIDDVQTISELLPRYEGFVRSENAQFQKILHRYEHITSLSKEIPHAESLFHRPSHADTWRRFGALVLRLKADLARETVSDTVSVLKRTIMELVVRQDPNAAVYYSMWAVLPRLQAQPLDAQIPELESLLSRIDSGTLNLPLPDGTNAAKVTNQIRTELDYTRNKLAVQQFLGMTANATVEQQLDAISAANRGTALMGCPSMIDGTMLYYRSRVFSAIGIFSDAIRDLSLAGTVYTTVPGSRSQSPLP